MFQFQNLSSEQFHLNHTKNLEVFLKEFLSQSESERPSESEIKDALKDIHSNKIQYLEFVRHTLVSCSEHIDQNSGANDLYFSQYVNSKIDAKYRDDIKRMFLWPVVLLVCYQYEPSSTERGSKSKKSQNLSYEKYFQEFLLVIEIPTSIDQKEIDDKKDYEEFRRLFRHYSSIIEEMINYSPQDEDEQKKKHLTIEYVTDYIIEPFLTVLPRRELPEPGGADSSKLTEVDVAMTFKTFFEVLLCVFNIVVTRTEVDFKTFLDSNQTKIHSYVCEENKNIVTNLKPIVEGDVSFRTEVLPCLKLYPDGKVRMSVITQNSLFNMDTSYFEFRNFDGKKEAIVEPVNKIAMTVFPIEVKTEITNGEKSISEEDLTTTSDDISIIQNILQQLLIYTLASEEIISQMSLLTYSINNEVHVCLVTIDFDSLKFEDGPNNTKTIRLKTIEKEGRSFKVIPIKIDELGSLSNFNSSNTTMVKLFAKLSNVFHKVWKDSAVLVENHLKVLAIRDELRIKERKSESKGEAKEEERAGIKKRPADQSDKSNKRTKTQGHGQSQSQSQSQTRHGTESKVEKDSTSPVDIDSGNTSTNPSSSGSDELAKMRDIEHLKISFSNNNEGHLDYVANRVINPKYPKLNTVRGINLHHRFGIQLDSQDIVGAQTLFMGKDCFLKGKKAALERFGSSSDADDVEVLNTASSNLTNDLVFKYYTPWNIIRSLQLGDWIDEKTIDISSIEEYEDRVIQPKYQNELTAMDRIHKFNETQKDSSKKISIPKVLMTVNELDMYLGPHTCQEMEFIIITERLIQEQEWDKILPLEANVINKACEQIELMIRHAGIRQNDIKLDNLIYYNQHIYFIDFDLSEDYKTEDKESIESAIKEDQKLLRDLLENPI